MHAQEATEELVLAVVAHLTHDAEMTAVMAWQQDVQSLCIGQKEAGACRFWTKLLQKYRSPNT